MHYFYEKKFLINFLVIRESPNRKGRIDAWSIPSIYYLSKWWPGSLAYSRGDRWVLKNDCYELVTVNNLLHLTCCSYLYWFWNCPVLGLGSIFALDSESFWPDLVFGNIFAFLLRQNVPGSSCTFSILLNQTF